MFMGVKPSVEVGGADGSGDGGDGGAAGVADGAADPSARCECAALGQLADMYPALRCRLQIASPTPGQPLTRGGLTVDI